jgi:general secretion pathway protein A
MIYEAFYGLKESPFELTGDTRFVYLPEPHREALNALTYAVLAAKPVTVLTGDVGTGKTTIVRAALQAQPSARSRCVHLPNPRLTPEELFEAIARGFELAPDARASKVACLAALEARLLASAADGQSTILVIDEAQSASDEFLEEVRLLTNIEAGSGKRLSVILVGQPEFGDRLNDPALQNLKQRIAVRCALRRLTLRETAGYIASRIRTAGGAADRVFTREAVETIHEIAQGTPRIISVLCDNALLTGYALNERPVSRRVVEEVCRDFDLGSSMLNAEEVVVPITRGRSSTEQQLATAAAAAPPEQPADQHPVSAEALFSNYIAASDKREERRWFGFLSR